MAAVFHFDNAIVREPAASVVRGLRAADRGAPTVAGVRDEFRKYVAALEAAGLHVETLPSVDAFPDSVFVEDPALVFSEGAILLRPGAPSRRGEAAAIASALRRRFTTVLEVEEGSVEGGDVLVTPRTVLIGLSSRTNEQGARALVRLLERFGRRAEIVVTPPGVLHFKSDCSLLDEETILSTRRLSASGVFAPLRVIEAPEDEGEAANALRVNDRVLVGDRFPRTLERLSSSGYEVVPLPGAEIARLDAGFSCLSLRWKARPAQPTSSISMRSN